MTGVPEGIPVNYSYSKINSNNWSYTVPTNAEVYRVCGIVEATENTNRQYSTVYPEFTISKATIHPEVYVKGWLAGTTPNEPTVTGNIGNGVITYTYAVKGSSEFSSTAPTTAGEYTIKAVIGGTSNTYSGEATADFTVFSDASDIEAAEAVAAMINALPAAADVTISDKEDIEAARGAYDALTDAQEALIDDETLAKLVAAEEALAVIELPVTKENATSEVNAVDPEDYITTDRQTVRNAKSTALAAIEAAATIAEVEDALTDFNTAIADCTTQAAADLAAAKTNAENEVNAVNAADYVTDDQQKVTNAKSTALAAIEAAATIAEAEDALTDFNIAIADCTTQAAAFVDHRLSLDGGIGFYFYVDLSREKAQNASLSFSWADQTREDVALEFDPVTGYYRALCSVASAEMTSDITATLKINGEEKATDIYSAKDYVIDPECDEATSKLVKAMLNYGAASQVYLNVNTDNLANASLSEEDRIIADVTPAMIKANAPKYTLPKGVKFAGATLSLQSETTLSIYLTSKKAVTDGECGDYEVETTTSGSYKVLRIRGIKAEDLDKDLTVTFTISGKQYSVTYSPMYYCRSVLMNSSADENLKTAVKALYWYWQAAKEYAESALLG